VGKRGRQRERLAAPVSEYEHPEHGTLALRGALTPATRAEYASLAPKVLVRWTTTLSGHHSPRRPRSSRVVNSKSSFHRK